MTLMELLVAVVILSVVTSMVLLVWSAMGDSYSMTTSSTKARELARDAVARLGRELRDAERLGANPALTVVTTDEIVFTTTFNDPANDEVKSEPVLTRYWYEWDESTGYGVLHRQRDTAKNADGLYGTLDENDRDTVVLRHVLNPVDEDTGDAELFRYSYVESSPSPGVVEAGPPPSAYALPTVFLVHISLSVDLNPGESPAPMDLSTAVQLRNQSRF